MHWGNNTLQWDRAGPCLPAKLAHNMTLQLNCPLWLPCSSGSKFDLQTSLHHSARNHLWLQTSQQHDVRKKRLQLNTSAKQSRYQWQIPGPACPSTDRSATILVLLTTLPGESASWLGSCWNIMALQFGTEGFQASFCWRIFGQFSNRPVLLLRRLASSLRICNVPLRRCLLGNQRKHWFDSPQLHLLGRMARCLLCPRQGLRTLRRLPLHRWGELCACHPFNQTR